MGEDVRKDEFSRGGLKGLTNLGLQAVSLAALVLLLAGCLNPLGGGGDSPDAGAARAADAPGSLTISLGSLGASTVAPGAGALAANTAYYGIELVQPAGAFDPITRSDLSPGSFPFTIPAVPATVWNLTLTAYNAGGQAIGRSAETEVDVAGGGTNVAITVSALQSGSSDGTLEYDLSWPTTRANGVTVSLFEVTDPTNPLNQANVVNLTEGTDYDLSLQDGTLSMDKALPSGLYYLAVDFTVDGSPLPSVYEAVQIYDHLVSSKSVTLTTEEFAERPVAPTALTVAFTGEDTFDLSWTDNANMEEGYRVYFNPDGDDRFQLGDDLTGGTSQVTGLTTGLLAGATGAVEVEAYNIYGASAVLSQSVVIQSDGGTFFNLSGDLRTNDATWAAAGDPGGINWEDLVIGGGDSNELHLGTDEATVAALSGDPAVTNIVPVFDLAGLQTYTRGTTYYWALAFRDGGNTVRGPVGSFTIRESDIYVSEADGDDANPGTPESPVATIGEAMSMVEEGETIHVAVGDYPGEISHLANPVSVTLLGGYRPDFSDRIPAFDLGGYPVTAGSGVSTIRSNGTVLRFTAIGVGEFVRVEGFHLQGGDDAVFFSGSGDALLRDSIIENGSGDPGLTGFVHAVRGENSGRLEVIRNRFDLGPGALTSPGEVRSLALLVGEGGGGVLISENVVESSQAIGEITAIYANTNAARDFDINNNQFQQMNLAADSTWDGRILLAQGDTTGARGEFRDNTVRMTVGPRPATGLDLSSVGPFNVHRNRFVVDGNEVDGAATAVEIRQGSEPVNVYNNVMTLDSYTEIGRFVSISGERAANIDNNTFVADGAEPDAWNLLYRTGGTATVNVRNNIARGFSTSTGQPIYVTATTGLNIYHNLFWFFQPDGFYLGQVYQSVADLNALDIADYNVAVDPLLDPGADWALTADSPVVARGGGVPLAGVTGDFGANSRTGEETLGYSMGAHENDTQARLTRADVRLVFGDDATGSVWVGIYRGGTLLGGRLLDVAPLPGNAGLYPFPLDVEVTPGETLALEVIRTSGSTGLDITYDGSIGNPYPWGGLSANEGDWDLTFITWVEPNLAGLGPPVTDQQQLVIRNVNQFVGTQAAPVRQTFIVGAPAP
ncbi:MAG: DUF1565 domain-containing protein [Spirochaetaceae bacterium]